MSEVSAPAAIHVTYVDSDMRDVFVNLSGIQLAHELALATATHQPFDPAATARRQAESLIAASSHVNADAIDRIAAAVMTAMAAYIPPSTDQAAICEQGKVDVPYARE
jgi:hypothetical protein